jgi:dTDP-4-amino-4,6-dideoxygalactose transaminase
MRDAPTVDRLIVGNLLVEMCTHSLNMGIGISGNVGGGMGDMTTRGRGGQLLPSDQNMTGRSFGPEEEELVREVLESGILFAPKGRMVKQFEREFARFIGTESAVACSSGTAAVHCAVAAIDPEPGDEVITTPITDMGALSPIVYQGAVPVFADVDPLTGNVTAQTVQERLSPRTRAVVVTHLFGNPADVDGIVAVARRGGIPVIEDCAQAYGAAIGQRHVGTIGEYGTFSLQQGKHMTTGEGGLVVSSSPESTRRMRLFVNKAWDYDTPGDHDFLALNYRMSELVGAVGRAQVTKLTGGIEARVKAAAVLDATLLDAQGLTIPTTIPGATHSYWRYPILVDPAVIPGGPNALAQQLKTLGIPSAPRYIQKPAFRCGIFVNQKTLGSSRFPFDLARPEALDYSTARFEGTFKYLERVLVLPWNEKYDEEIAAKIGDAICTAVERLVGAGS